MTVGRYLERCDIHVWRIESPAPLNFTEEPVYEEAKELADLPWSTEIARKVAL